MSSTKVELGESATELDIHAPHPAARASAPEIGAGQGPAGQPSRGDAIGRFVVLGILGTGGMGNVYSGYDPHLDRKVAIKVLNAELARDGADARTRLLREAQAMAKINHPNVITVHEVGELGDQVYVAMEFADGGTLRAWLKGEQRSRRELLDRFVQAGRGLAAAHAEGLVHRDFKPDNVLLQKDGSVRVTDFGLVSVISPPLARAQTAPITPPEPSPEPLMDSGITPLSAELTRTGAVMGTPSYMAPEQFAGSATDARTDQFSFCVALYEALYGQRPFSGDTFQALSTAVLLGTVSPAPKGATVPAWLRRVLVRGLAVEPANRHPSMNALLARLTRETANKKVAFIAAGSALAAVVAAGVVVHQSGHGAECATGEDKIAAVWNAQRREALAHAFAASGRPAAPAWSAAAAAQVDRWMQGWSSAYVDACEATRVHGDQSEHLLDLRVQCLTRRLDDTRATIEQITAGDAESIDHALPALHALPSLVPCGDRASLLEAVPPPDPSVAVQVDAVRQQLAKASALHALGKYRDALVIASDALAIAKATHYRPVIAEAALKTGKIQYRAGDNHATLTFRDALYSALEAGDQKLEIDAAAALVNTLHTNEVDEAQEIGQIAEAISHHGSPDASEVVTLQNAIALLESKRGKLAEAQARYEKTLVLARGIKGDDSERSTLAQLAEVEKLRGNLDAARSNYEQVLAVDEKAYGKDHPMVANSLNNLGNVYIRQGKLDEAKQMFDRALAIRVAALGPDHPEVGTSYNNLGNFYINRGDRPTAHENYLRALAIWEKAWGPDSGELVSALANLGTVESDQGDYVQARTHLERALAIYTKTEGADGPDVAGMLMNIGVLDENEKKLAEAMAKFQRAEQIAVKAYGADAVDTADVLANEAGLYRQDNKLAKAEELATRALHIYEKQLGPDHARVGAMLVGLGELQATKHDHAGALATYQRGLQILLAKMGPDGTETAVAQLRVAKELLALGRPTEALPLAEHGLAVTKANQGSPDDVEGAQQLRDDVRAALAKPRRNNK